MGATFPLHWNADKTNSTRHATALMEFRGNKKLCPGLLRWLWKYYITTKITWELVLFGKDSIPLFYWIGSALKPVGANIRIEHINSDSWNSRSKPMTYLKLLYSIESSPSHWPRSPAGLEQLGCSVVGRGVSQGRVSNLGPDGYLYRHHNKISSQWWQLNPYQTFSATSVVAYFQHRPWNTMDNKTT